LGTEGVEFLTFLLIPLTFVVVLKTLWHGDHKTDLDINNEIS